MEPSSSSPDTNGTSIPGAFDLVELARRLRANVDIADRDYHLKTYKNCFVGRQACRWLVDSGVASDIAQAELIGNVMIGAGVFHHVVRDHDFKCDHLFYRFADDESHGRRGETARGDAISWGDLLGPMNVSESGAGLQPRLPDQVVVESAAKMDTIGVEPMDEANVALLDAGHPPSWVNPQPDERYNMAVIGAGTGGLVTAAVAAGLGGKVALIEENLMGGDCLNRGCVPSKTLLRAARAAHRVRAADRFGVHIRGDIDIDFAEIMQRVRSVRAKLSAHDSAERFADELGVDVFLGRARFVGRNTVRVDDTDLDFSAACIATGASPAAPPIDGLTEAPYLTNASLFNLTRRPPRLGIIGAGPIGVEIAQAFARLGSHVTLIDINDHILARETDDAAAVVAGALQRDGVAFELGAHIRRVSHQPAASAEAFPTIQIHLADSAAVEIDQLLVAAGRRPNVTDMGLDAAGVDFDEHTGVSVNERLQTTNSSIYAVGDVATRYQFTHAADFMARIAVRNALFFGRQSFDDLLIPWCTYTDPGLAHVGLYPDDLDDRGVDYTTFAQPFDQLDRAVIDDHTDGFVRVQADSSGTVLGATVVGPDAGDLISELAVAMRADLKLADMADVIHPYPTNAEAIHKIGDAFNRTRLTPTAKKLLRGVLAMRR